jgi:TPP-dependent pyruvate/acetoin dehydrogenase alpha subunit
MQMNSETVAQKAIAYGMPTIQVDGNDLFAVYKASKDAIERARAGGGPSFIEAVTYRLADHTTADDARRYRDPGRGRGVAGKDPIIRLRKYLTAKGLWNDAKQDYTFAQPLPAELERQKTTMRTSSLGQDPGQVGLGAAAQEV